MRLWLSPDEQLVIVHQTIQTGLIFNVTAYEVSGESHRVLTSQNVSADSTGVITSTIVVGGPALLESVNCQIVSGTVVKGQLAIGCHVRRLSGALSLLAYVSPIVFPSTNYPAQLLYEATTKHPDEGYYNRTVTGTDQAANTEIGDTVPTGVDWLLKSARVTLVTDANAANRRVQLFVDDGASVLWRTVPGTDIAASSTGVHNYFPAGQLVASNNNNQVCLIPDSTRLLEGYRVGTVTTNLQVGDNFAAPVYEVWERLTLAR